MMQRIYRAQQRASSTCTNLQEKIEQTVAEAQNALRQRPEVISQP